MILDRVDSKYSKPDRFSHTSEHDVVGKTTSHFSTSCSREGLIKSERRPPAAKTAMIFVALADGPSASLRAGSEGRPLQQPYLVRVSLQRVSKIGAWRARPKGPFWKPHSSRA